MKRSKTQTYTKLKVSGEKEHLDEFVKIITDDDGEVQIFSNSFPIPGPSQEQVMFWGAVFGDYSTKIVRHSSNELVIEFWSYWDPLVRGMISISMIFPKLTFAGAYVTTLKATLGRYVIMDGQCESGELTPNHSLEMMNFCCEWDEAMEESWFRLADNWVADMIGEPLAS